MDCVKSLKACAKKIYVAIFGNVNDNELRSSSDMKPQNSINRYNIAVVTVYALLMVKKLLEKCATSDPSHQSVSMFILLLLYRMPNTCMYRIVDARTIA